MSGCKRDWPGSVDKDDYVQECPEFIRITTPKENWVKGRL
jgi:hypothetical protein